jgi:calcineurin-like phosphoesterase family protein
VGPVEKKTKILNTEAPPDKKLSGAFFVKESDVNNIFFSADLHLNHDAIRRYCGRPFSSVEEMDEAIITNWNNKVGDKDLVYLLGDFCFLSKREDILKIRNRLKGNIVLMEGNHDRNIGSPGNFGFASKHKMLELKIEGQYITLCHYSLRVWPRSHYDSWSLFGHSHGCLESIGKSMDVGVDCNNFTPVSFEEVKAIMEQKPHNFNWVERLKGFNRQEYEDNRSTEMS